MMIMIIKLMMLHQALNLRDDIDRRLYVPREEGEKELANIEDCQDATNWGLKNIH